MENVSVSELYYYPIKSCGGIELSRGEVIAKGFQLDRHWMVTDENGLFITQRQKAQLALVRPEVGEESLIIKIKGRSDSVEIPFSDEGQSLEVEVWGNKYKAISDGKLASDFLSNHLGKKALLVHMASGQVREVDTEYGRLEFADSYPFLIVSESSLNDLNARISENDGRPIPINRFRPNIVLAGNEPYEEDSWAKIKIGDLPFDLGEHAVRCITTTTNQETAERGKNPLKTLSAYRKVKIGGGKNGVIFGQRAVQNETGYIELGDKIEILETKDPHDYSKLLDF